MTQTQLAPIDRVAAAIERNGSLNIVALEGLIDEDPIVISAALARLEETGTVVRFYTERHDGRQFANWRLA